MEKLKKQMAFNIALLAVSFIVIYFSVSFKEKYFVHPKECLNADFVFVLITSLASMLSWRWVDGIRGNIFWNAFSISIFSLIVFAFGATMAMEAGAMRITIVQMCWIVFAVTFIGEGLVILFHVKTVEKNNNSIA